MLYYKNIVYLYQLLIKTQTKMDIKTIHDKDINNNNVDLWHKAQKLAFDNSLEIVNEKSYFKFEFNFFELNGKTYRSFVYLPKSLKSLVDSKWTTDDFNKWERKQSIYISALIKDITRRLS